MTRTRKNIFCLEPLENRCLLSAGSLDTTFGAGGAMLESANITPNDTVVESNGQIVISDSTRVMRFNADGSPDTTFGTDGVVTAPFPVVGVAVQSDGKILIAGNVTTGWAVARVNVNGTLDATFGSGTGQVITYADDLTLGQQEIGVGIQPDGDIIVGGSQTQPEQRDGGVFLNCDNYAAVCFNPDGSLNLAFGDNGETTSGTSVSFDDQWSDEPNAMAVSPNGNITVAGMIGGDFNTRGGAAVIFGTSGTILTAMSMMIDAYWSSVSSASGLADNSFAYAIGTGFEHEDSVYFSGPGVSTPFVLDSSLTAVQQMPIAQVGQANGQTVVVGADPNGAGLIRYNADGSIDMTFGSGGMDFFTATDLSMTANPAISDVAIEANGNILLDGTSPSGQLFLASIETTGASQPPPIAYCNPATIMRSRRRYQFTVEYSAGQSIDLSSLGNANIIAIGPRGIHERVTLVSTSSSGGHAQAIYSVKIPKLRLRRGKGTVSLYMQADQVFDNLGNPIAPKLLAQFKAIFD